jgi:ferrochelatase
MTAGKKPLCVFLMQLGGPHDMAAIEPFLRNLLADVLPGPRWLRRPLANRIAARRAPRVATSYEKIGGGSPLLPHTEAQAQALVHELSRRGVDAQVLIAMRYAPPRAADALAAARQHASDRDWVALPLYPQYSLATTASSFMELQELLTEPERAGLLQVDAYPTEPGFLAAVAERVREALRRFPAGEPVEILFSAHSLPLSYVRKGDPYPEQIRQTVAGVAALLGGENSTHLAFQSRLGPVKWLTPSTVDKTRELAAAGAKNLLVVPVAFVSEHLETLFELDIELAELAQEAGIVRFERAATVGTHRHFMAALAELVTRAWSAVR